MSGNTNITSEPEEIYQNNQMPETNAIPNGFSVPGSASVYLDSEVPHEISSEDIIFFNLNSSYDAVAGALKYRYVNAYASKTDDGALISLIFRYGGPYSGEDIYTKIALTDKKILEDIQQIVKKYRFALNNGYMHNVNGLPGMLGGKVDIRYSSKERICFSDNQSPVVDVNAASEISDLIKKYIEEKSYKTLNVWDISAVRYREEKGDGCYADYLLEGDQLVMENRFGEGDEKLFKSEKAVPADALDKVRQMAEKGLLLHWKGLFETSNPVFPDRKDSVIFTLKDGSTYEINNNMLGPVGNSVFDIQMYLMYELGQ